MKAYIICGGRAFADTTFFVETMLKHEPDIIIHGGAKGADEMAKEWARVNDLRVFEFKAQWKKHGRGAGPRRNKAMAKKLAELRWHYEYEIAVLAFAGGIGTANMIKTAETYRPNPLPVIDLRNHGQKDMFDAMP